MDSSEEMRSTFDSFKSKKILHSTSKSLPSYEPVKAPIESPWSSKTPEKSFNPPRRLRNRGAALSLKEVRQCAKNPQTRVPTIRPDPVISPDDQISSEPIQPPVTKPKRSVQLLEQRFSHCHLAQLKLIFPEAIEVEKILVRDERTCCMKPDLHVTLNFNAIETDGMSKSDSSNSGSLLLRKAFRARLFKFSEAHPEHQQDIKSRVCTSKIN